MEYILHIIIILNIYILLVLSANLPIGMSNLLSVAQASFYGIGAYLGAFFLIKFQLPFIVIALFTMFLTGVSSLIVSFASVKLKGDYFVLATLGFQMIIFTILYNWVEVTGGSYGIADIPHIQLFGKVEVTGVYGYFVLTTFLSLLIIFLFIYLKQSPFGRIIKAIRTDEIAVAALGRNPVSFKILTFFISAAFSGLAGMIYASYVSYIDPTSFSIDESIFILCALFIGGIGNVKGPIIGALFIIIIPELLRFIGLPDAVAANLRQIIYGLILIIIMYFRPQGLWGETVLK